MEKETLYKNFLEFNDGDEELTKKIIDVFIKVTGLDLDLLRAYRKQKNKEEILLLTHKLLPRLEMFGIIDTPKLTEKIEAPNSEKELYDGIDLLMLISEDMLHKLKSL